MINEILFKQSQLLRKQKIAMGVVTWDWKLFQFFTYV